MEELTLIPAAEMIAFCRKMDHQWEYERSGLSEDLLPEYDLQRAREAAHYDEMVRRQLSLGI